MLARKLRWGRGSRLARSLGRQLTRVGALSQRINRLAAAEFAFAAATRLEADPAWCLRLGRIREARQRWAGAEAAYRRAVDSGPAGDGRATGYYRQARLRARREDWAGAEAAFTAALRLRPDSAAWHAQRGEVCESQEDWSAAAASYREAARLEPDRPEWRTGLVRACTRAGRPDQAAEAGAAGAGAADPPLARALVTAYEQVGDWPAAAGLLREQVSRRPDDHALRTRLVDCLEQTYLVPFALDRRGLVAVPAETRRQRAAAAMGEVIEHLRHLVDHAPNRTGPAHRLGLLYERSGQLPEAAGAYRLAMERLAAVDSWWCHRAAHEWGFRLGYVAERLSPSGWSSGGTRGAEPPARADDRRLRRSATPAGSEVPEPAGFFDAVVFRHGLQLSGFLLPDISTTVDLYLDDALLKQVRVQTGGWRPILRYDITHGLLDEFPDRSRLTMRANGRPLVTVDGSEALEIQVPGGTGKVPGKLAKGLSPTKKGGWPRTGTKLAQRQESYLRVYERARVLLEEQGRQLFLCYGTLLGCHREGRFIPGDDDFDVSYTSHASDPERFRQECWQILLGLLRQGLDVNLSINGRLFKVGLDGVWIDVTPMWFYRGRAWAFDAHDLAPEAFEPVRVTEFLGQTAYLPGDPEAFLADTYGPGWRTPQPEFRYYRSKADDRVLSQMWAKPSEVRAFARQAEAERARNPAAGRFVGVGHPGYPGFSWLTAPDGPLVPESVTNPARAATGG